ncbi:histidine-tRNA ligase [Ephemerocybe angulata]|uniref:histidine--tRNA ligase n=1 Tax=Ephemerocybe angulata TaxID=980116 RepID=A0A8H6MD55_9AGAR|nr:histidine-tRNA ligase [Tulosesus angulatus]
MLIRKSLSVSTLKKSASALSSTSPGSSFLAIRAVHPKSTPYITTIPPQNNLNTITMSSAIPTTPEALEAEIAVQTTRFNELRLNTDKSVATPEALNDAKKKLAELKKALGVAKAAGKERPKKDVAVAGEKADEKKKERLLLKTAKGTRDFGPSEIASCKDVFTSFGGSCLDTPVFERKDVLTDKYGEDSKLIFDLKDQGGEELALRYDHTVPLARYLAMNGGTVTHSKIWQVGRCTGETTPSLPQADFDIAGQWDPMVSDAELLSLLCTVLTRLEVGEFTIKLNNRKILDGIFEVCGVPAESIRPISSAVDKLDKAPWSEVKREMTEEKGLDPLVADKIGEYVKLKGGEDLIQTLVADATLMANKRAKEGVSEMEVLFRLLKAYQVTDKFSFDLSLARGLDYYTGIIYEAVAAAPAPKKKAAKKEAEDEPEIDESTVGVGSIAAGGRYDNLVTTFIAGANGVVPGTKEYKKLPNVPCIGVSIGMDRIFALVWPKWVEKSVRAKETFVYVMSAGDGLLEERIGLVRELREAGVKTDFLAKTKPKLSAQFAAGEKDEVPFAVIVGTEELGEGFVTVKEQRWVVEGGKKVKVESADKGTKVKRSELVEWLKASAAWAERETREWA